MELLPHVEKLELILGYKLNITPEILLSKITDVIERQLQQHRLDVLLLDPAIVNWDRLVEDAAFRRPPFDPKQREKGFRDSLICESFLQLIEKSPKTPQRCRIILVSGDELLKKAVSLRINTAENVRLFSKIDEVKGFINTLVSQVSESFVAELTEIAERHFYKQDSKDALLHREDVIPQLNNRFRKELAEVPAGADSRENGTWYVGKPRFMKKEGRTVYWVSRIEVEATAYRFERRPRTPAPQSLSMTSTTSAFGTGQVFIPNASFSQAPPLPLSVSSGITSSAPLYAEPGSPGFTVYPPSGGLLDLIYEVERKVFKKGFTVLEVEWSVRVNQHKKFSASKIEDLRFVETSWE